MKPTTKQRNNKEHIPIERTMEKKPETHDIVCWVVWSWTIHIRNIASRPYDDILTCWICLWYHLVIPIINYDINARLFSLTRKSLRLEKKTYIYIVHRTKILSLDIPLKNNNSCGFLILLQRFLNNYLQRKKEIAFSKRHVWLIMLHADIKISVYRWIFSYFRFHLRQKLNIFKTLVCICFETKLYLHEKINWNLTNNAEWAVVSYKMLNTRSVTH